MDKDKYYLVVKFADEKTNYINKFQKIEESAVGHVWLEAFKPKEPTPISRGWVPKTDDKTNLTGDDYWRYIDEGEHISKIKIQVTKEQYDKFLDFANKTENKQNVGRFDSTKYNVLTNSCVDYGAVALSYIGLADSKFEGSRTGTPSEQFRPFLEQIIKNQVKNNQTHMDLEIEYLGEKRVIQPNEKKNMDLLNKQLDGLELLKNPQRWAQSEPEKTPNQTQDKNIASIENQLKNLDFSNPNTMDLDKLINQLADSDAGKQMIKDGEAKYNQQQLEIEQAQNQTQERQKGFSRA